jgi:hypothetical protein
MSVEVWQNRAENAKSLWSLLFGGKFTHHSVGNHSAGPLAELFQTHCEDECGDKEEKETAVWVNGEVVLERELVFVVVLWWRSEEKSTKQKKKGRGREKEGTNK